MNNQYIKIIGVESTENSVKITIQPKGDSKPYTVLVYPHDARIFVHASNIGSKVLIPGVSSANGVDVHMVEEDKRDDLVKRLQLMGHIPTI